MRAHREGRVELGRESVKVRCEGGSGGGRVADKEGDRPTIVDFGCDRVGEDALRIPQATSSYVGEGGSDQGRLLVLGGGETGSVESSFSRRERLQWLGIRPTVASRCHLGGREGALILLAIGSASRGGLGVHLVRVGAVGGEMPSDEGGGVRVLPFSQRVRFP